MGYFSHMETLPHDSIFELMWAFKRDPRPKKIDLSVGIYYNQQLGLDILKSVKKAEEAFVELEVEKAYLPIDGNSSFIEGTKKLLFGEVLTTRLGGAIYGAQTVGGTASLRVGGEFLAKAVSSVIHLSDPTWANHPAIFARAGLKTAIYPYYSMQTNRLVFDDMMQYLKTLPPKSVVLLHGCCHNPTGCDPTQQQWKEISSLMLKKQLIPFFDVAYQGFGDGLEEDAFAVRYFAEQGHEMLISFSYSKIFGLYAERVGALFLVAASEKEAVIGSTHIRALIRANYSNPPKHGAVIVSYVLNDEKLKALWLSELEKMRRRIIDMRSLLYDILSEKTKRKDYTYLSDAKGMFCFTGLEKSQVERLIDEYGIYMLKTGRINVTGLNEDNIHYVGDAIIKVSEG
ncbi:MAG: amino acid aminotransferase [Chlamydiota bacterium]